MTNPFEETEGTYLVLVNAEGQHSLWPAAVEVPGGWTVADGPGERTRCLEYVRTHWTDLRPQSLVTVVGGSA